MYYRLITSLMALSLIAVQAACNFPQTTLIATEGAAPSEIPAPTASPPENTSAPAAPAETASGTQSPPLTDFKMINEQDGWGLGGQLVWRTVDGAAQWNDVTPPGYGGQGEDGSGFFLDTNTAWVLLPNAGSPDGALYQTRDGGYTWKSSTTPFADGQLFFLDSMNGWALSIPSTGANSTEADVYQTTDGGVTWSEVYNMDPKKPNAPAGLPLKGAKNGLSFRDATHGWVTGSVPVDSYVWLFETADGGKTWQQQQLTTPVDEQSHQLSIDPPAFFGSQDGLLPVEVITDTIHWDFFLTHDGGDTWTSTSISPGSGHYDFVTMTNGFIWDVKALYVTQDGGMSWSAIKPNVDLSQTLIKLDFVTPRTGWALALDSNGDARLYKTTDGGASWGP